jgi:hypothetical protein
MTVCWHVDDLKVSHIDQTEVTKFGRWLSTTYGIAVAEHRGKIHDHLGMILDFTMEGHVIINMTEYIKPSSTISRRRSQSQKQRQRQIIFSRCGTQTRQACYRKNKPRRFTTQWLNFCS